MNSEKIFYWKKKKARLLFRVLEVSQLSFWQHCQLESALPLFFLEAGEASFWQR